MDLLLVRHADAGDAAEFASSGQSDDKRPLSAKGEQQMRQAAIAIRELLPSCDTIASSPLTRAVQTAEILCSAYGLAAPQTTRTLVPGVPLPEFWAWVGQFDETQCVAVVGHEPQLSELATWLLTGADESRLDLKKGSACLVAFPGAVRPRGGTLRWLLTPRQLELVASSLEARV